MHTSRTPLQEDLVTYRKFASTSTFLELKTVFLAVKSCKHLCRDQIVLIATDSTTVVFYINKEGGMRSDSLCALETSVLVSPQRNSSEVSAHSRLLECNSRQAFQTQSSDQTVWSLSQVFNIWCMWSFLQPGSITHCPSFFHRYPIQQPGQ